MDSDPSGRDRRRSDGIDVVVRIKLFAFGLGADDRRPCRCTLRASQATFAGRRPRSTSCSAVEILTFVVVGCARHFPGVRLLGAFVLSLLPEFLRTLRRVAGAGYRQNGPNLFPMNRVYDLPARIFSTSRMPNASIVYGLILGLR